MRASPADRLALEVPLEPAALEQAQEELAAFLEQAGMPAPVRYRVRLVVEELVANLMMHGRFAGPPPPVRVEARCAPDEVRLAIEDAAEPFDPRLTPDPDAAPRLEDETLGGLGLPLVRRMSRILGYHRLPVRWNRTELAVPVVSRLQD